jgi:hypothetical protein
MPLSWFRRGLFPRKQSPRRSVPLNVEQLEDRLTPASIFAQGDILLGLNDGTIEIHAPDGTYLQTLDTKQFQARGMAFDAGGNLYATTWSSGSGKQSVVEFDPNGNLLGSFGSGYNGRPESVVIDGDGNVYVGSNSSGVIRKFSPTGTPLGVFNVNIGKDAGTDWTQLSPDLTTLDYTGEGKTIYRANAATGQQFSPLITNLPGQHAYALRFLPTDCSGNGGGLIVADSATIVQVNDAGSIVFQYDATGVNTWFGLNRDPDGVSFLSAALDGGTCYRFDYGVAAPVAQFNLKATGNVGIVGIAVVGELLTFPADSTPPMYAVGTQTGSSEVKVYDPTTNALVYDIQAFPGFTGGVRVTMADINHDGIADIVIAAGPGGGPRVLVLDGSNPTNILYSFYAFEPAFNGGVTIAAADLNGDGFADIVCGTLTGAPHVVAFSGADLTQLTSFYAFDPAFLGGVSVGIGDIDDNGIPDIICGAGPGGGPRVRVFEGTTGQQLVGPLGSFFAFEQSYTGGVNVAVGHLLNQCQLEIITGAATGAPHVKVYDGATGNVLFSFYAGPLGFLFFPDGSRNLTGVQVGATDLNGDGLDDFLTSFSAPGYPEVKGYDGLTGAVIDDFTPYDNSYAGGLTIGGKISLGPM